MEFKILQPSQAILKRAMEAERNVLLYSDLNLDKEIIIRDIPINYLGKNHIHTIECGMQNKNKMIIIHGFGATGLTFYKMFKNLSSRYHVYCLDLLGMGLSSRPDIKLNTSLETTKFFTDSIEEWRASLKLSDFHLVGHSLGGYLAANYALSYPQNLKRLSLMSPVGITQNKQFIINNMQIYRKIGAKISAPFWNLKLSYQRAFKISGFIGFALADGIVRFKYPKLSYNESKALGNYFSNVLHLPKSKEDCIYNIFEPPVPCARMPLEENILKSNLKINFYFGETDWMDTHGVNNLCRTDPSRFKNFIIKDSGHNMKLENPKEISEFLINLH